MTDNYMMYYYKKNKERCPYLYEQLEPFFANREFSYLRKDHEDYVMITQYLKNTHSSSHNVVLEIKNIYRVFRETEYNRYKPFKNNFNRKLLWHGSRADNFSGILSNGLLSAPIAPVNGKMFGNGIYFADVSTKSAQYCNLTIAKNSGFLMLCEVALGDELELRSANTIHTLPEGYGSVKGIGKTHPDPNKNEKRTNGSVVPLGTLIPSNQNSSLHFNEYIVYEEARVLIKFLVEIETTFNNSCTII